MSIAPTKTDSGLRTRLHRFMSRPQRHRLLHGYPLAAAMPYADNETRALAAAGDAALAFSIPQGSELLVGVLPHPFCNPKIRGCGFCTFPHETYGKRKSSTVAKAVAEEVRHRLSVQPELRKAPVSGLYFGGGTANLTPPEPFRRLAQTLADAFDLTIAEVSLEGVPGQFLRGKPLLIDVMREELPARHFRISMGMQTFSESRLEQMGRLGFGRPSVFGAVVKAAHHRGMTASGDLLFNLPGQTLTEMRADVQRAIELGLDQICLYHLVMFRGLGTAWSRNETLLSALPSNEEGADNWLSLRELLLSSGYRQTSLTNFERVELASDPRRYRYEPISYESDRCQVLGFGPAGISFSADSGSQYALKTMNPESSAEYLHAIQSKGPTWNRHFRYHQSDLELLHFTRRLAALRIDKASFSESFNASAWTRHLSRLAVLVEAGLLNECRHAYSVTPRGMFYSDSIAALLADGRLPRGQRHGAHNDNSSGHM